VRQVHARACALISRGASFVSNDRLLLRKQKGKIEMAGIPKARASTPVRSSRIRTCHPILEPARRARLATMPFAELWALEEKYDVDIERLFAARIACACRPICVRWSCSPGSPAMTVSERVPRHSRQRPELIDLIAKHPGPFHRGAVATRPGTSSVHALDPKPYWSSSARCRSSCWAASRTSRAAAELCDELLS